jgi:hypothetical protein
VRRFDAAFVFRPTKNKSGVKAPHSKSDLAAGFFSGFLAKVVAAGAGVA